MQGAGRVASAPEWCPNGALPLTCVGGVWHGTENPSTGSLAARQQGRSTRCSEGQVGAEVGDLGPSAHDTAMGL